MFSRYSKRIGVLAGAVALVATASLGSTPAAAASLCPGSRVPAFEAPDITMAPITGYFQVWGANVSVLAFCEDVTNPEDFSIPLPNIAVTGVSIISSGAVPDLQVSISSDGSGAFQGNIPTTFPGALFSTPGVVTDNAGNAHFVMKAESASTPNIGGPNGTPQLIGLHLDYSTGPVGGPMQFIMPDEGNVFAQTPELDSIFLFGSGAVGIAGYGLLRLRAKRRV